MLDFFDRKRSDKPQDDLAIPSAPEVSGFQSFNSEIWGLTSASGGAGVTTLCVQLAYALSTRPEVDNRVCLVDLDFEGGLVANYMDKIPNASLDDLSEQNSQIDESYTASLLTPYTPTLDLMVFTPELNGNAKVDPDKVLAILDNIAGMYDYVILDIPRLWAPWTHAALGASDRLFMLSELSVPNLVATRVRLDGLKSVHGLEHVIPNIIINKHERRSFRNSLKLGDAEKALENQVFGSICLQADVLREAMNRGEPVGLKHADSRYVKDVSELMNKVSTHANIQTAYAMSA